jgi:NADH:ubiquinone oxidoreductase subunit F (NADH-binding)/(2Fe-2S) ferredoxin/NAD-dependent dihydropyrimidine dehydrogenase PreA subunit
VPSSKTKLSICSGTGCSSNHSYNIREALKQELRTQGVDGKVTVESTGCHGLCSHGPIAVVEPDGIIYHGLRPEHIPHLVKEHLVKGQPVEELIFHPPEEETPIPRLMEIDFFKHQRLLVLRNRGLIDPENIDEYIARDGYGALAKALTEFSPEEIIEEVKRSGLRGRGGAGFPTGLKWERCRNTPGDEKFIICNADEGDPGAFMDRSVLEADPHAVLEGMAIGAYAIGANQGFIYVRDEYPLALKRLNIAIDRAMDYGFLGRDIFGTGINFSVKVIRGGGAFVCGEETALILSVEGKMGEPKQRPPYPVQRGLWDRPTVINNVETWANIPMIIARGAEWFSEIGTEKSKGTKIFSLVGKIHNTGLVEVPMGIPLREIIYGVGGGIPNGKEFKAVQTGGPSGGCLPASKLDLPVDYERLTEAGAIMGSGGMIVMDEDTCMVDVSRYFLDFLKEESCGKCVACREGIERLLEILTNICEGKGKEEDIELLEGLATMVKDFSLCALGGTAPNPVLSTLRYFKDEYLAHIRDRKCPAGVCTALIQYQIDPDKCDGCTACVKSCPTGAISGELKMLHTINQSECIKCGACREACKRDAVIIV